MKPCALAAAVSILVTTCVQWEADRRHLAEFRHQCERLAYRLDAMPDHSLALGAAATLAGTQETIRSLAGGHLPARDPGAEALLRRFARGIGADNAFVLDRHGALVGSARPPAPGDPLRDPGPWFRAAMAGSRNLYAALGAHPGERIVLATAPVPAGTGKNAAPVGAVAVELGFRGVDELLNGEPGRYALVSPEGVVFAANVPEWVFRVAGSEAQAALAAQAPRTALAYAGRSPGPLARDRRFRHALECTVDWQDPAGAWKLIALPDPGQLFAWPDRILVASLAFLAAGLAAAFWMERRRHREELAAVLEEGRERAEQAAEARAELLTRMSHEIRTPMNTITGLSHLALKAGPAPRVADHLRTILSASEHLLGLLNEVLDFARLEAGRVELERVAFPLSAVLGTVRDLVAQKAAAKGLELSFEAGPGVPPALEGDPLRLGQVLVNFASNAVKFTERGWVRVRVECLEQDAARALLRFSVQDTGPGLTAQARERLFQAFRQAAPSTARRHGGTGLGLAIAKDLAELMGGEVGVDSEPGRGSTFWFRVRLAKGALPDSGAPALAPLRTPQSPRVLVADDHELNRTIAAELLREAGIEVDLAADGAQAARMARERSYDLVLMDVQMPGLDGLAATAELRRDPALAGLPILALTAGAGDRERCLAAGMDGHIAKPCQPEELLGEVFRWIHAPRDREPQKLQDLPDEPPLEIPGLDTEGGLKRVLGRRPVYLAMLRSFAASQGTAPAQIRAALEQGGPDQAERLAHTLKGLLGTIGAGPLERWAGNLEGAIRQGRSPETLGALVDGLESRLAELLRELDRLPPAEDPAAAGPAADSLEDPAAETILVIDDSPDNRQLMARLLEGRYRVELAADGEDGLRLAAQAPAPDLILLDVMMPGADGYEVMGRLKADPATRDLPVIFLTSRREVEDERRGLELGAVDYITKPVSPPILLSRVNSHLKLKGIRDFLKSRNLYLELEVARRTREVAAIQDVTIQAMASLAETRDNETGGHIRRTQHYVRLLGLKLRNHPRFSAFLTQENLDLMFKSAPLHDIGKVGIPDRILLKPGRLTSEEFVIMKRHTTLGREAIEAAERQLGAPLPFLAIAKQIAEGHQEKWDGSGYPGGLRGDAIPTPARLMAVADVYDALISRRVYKPALSHGAALNIMVKGRGSHFDPDVLDAFVEVAESFRAVAERFRDADPEQAALERKAAEA